MSERTRIGDVTSLVDRLEALVAAHEAAGSPLRQCLRPPLRERDVVDHFALHPDVVALFTWHDGLDWDRWQKAGGRAAPELIPWVEFKSFDRCRRYGRMMLDSSPQIHDVWASATWFPVLFEGRNAVAVECGPGNRHGSVALASLDEARSYPLFPSLEELVDAGVTAFEQGHFSYGDGKLLPATEDVPPLDWLAASGRSRR